ncbi:hypothetical protein H310_04538 [Aphanomyces invadans]|uniref:Thiaminase-2/PQQC domain-containing protein n=1 Tax=Aphanomyces invadans TaxID=157072 RepID=A0A024UEW7_9STRA|nr:hypothetical protein H310_04538 [Aphanomyces invadans]ETW04193.1 hypothetical protein H310_04538 [Aphanomyces invadans]RHY35492.1 hypothetical protein DYB32_000033 [Aphanomyces invadans]|eukprot:XP_008867149.1 hypothetical protein H310_04538 [Aphanomyces invadans]
MERVMAHIDALNAQYAQHPLWDSLASGHGGKVARAKLQAFAPAISYFILAFRDFNDFVLPYDTPKTDLEAALNVHALEDSTHYKLFLEDWEKLGGDALLAPYAPLIAGLPDDDHRAQSTQSSASLAPSTRTLSFLWSDDSNRHNRKLMFALTKLIHESAADAPVRFAAVEAVEETGRVMFEATAKLANEIEASGGGTYRYFGEYHLALETGHVINNTPQESTRSSGCGCETDDKFKNLALSDAQEMACTLVVTRVFAIFTEWIDGIHRMMQMRAEKTL